MSRARHPLLVLVSVAAGGVASLASSEAGPDATGSLDDQALTLAQGESASFPFSATLQKGSEGSGEILLTLASDDDAPASVALTISSETTGEENSADVFDTSDQDETSIGIVAFEGCTSGACEERGTARFERLDAPNAPTFNGRWRLDAAFSPYGASEEDNSITVELVAAEP